jgi:SAM-dependent methyltransferase
MSSGAHSSAHSPPTAPPADSRSGGVGAGLATASWWEQYYRQQHDSYWDWYLPNDVVLETLMQEARALCRIREPTFESDSDVELSADAEAPEDASSAGLSTLHNGTSAALVRSCSGAAASRLSALPCLQLGCGNSEVTALLWQNGVRTMCNVDFSAECIERMQLMQKEKGWTSAEKEKASMIEPPVSDPTAAAAPSSANSLATSASALLHCFCFAVMDVRSLSFPSCSFSLVFDKGTLDCVVLESSDSHASATRMLREVWRVLKPGGVYVCFSLYAPTARARYFIDAMPESEGGESEEERAELLDVLTADNPPRELHTSAWSSLRMLALDCSPLELPHQKYTYLYVATKR